MHTSIYFLFVYIHIYIYMYCITVLTAYRIVLLQRQAMRCDQCAAASFDSHRLEILSDAVTTSQTLAQVEAKATNAPQRYSSGWAGMGSKDLRAEMRHLFGVFLFALQLRESNQTHITTIY